MRARPRPDALGGRPRIRIEDARLPMTPTESEATRLLQRLRAGHDDAGHALFALLYDELRTVAEGCMARERRDHTLQPTELVHEVWVRTMGDRDPASFEDRSHFVSSTARAMRHVLVDHARARAATKRGGGAHKLPLDAVLGSFDAADIDVLELHDAIDALEAMDPALARLGELRYFAGLTIRETADVQGVTTTSVERGWRVARMWLRKTLGPRDDDEE